jgi:hypothetical protein
MICSVTSELLVTLVIGFAALVVILTGYEVLGWIREDKKEGKEKRHIVRKSDAGGPPESDIRPTRYANPWFLLLKPDGRFKRFESRVENSPPIRLLKTDYYFKS